MATVHKFHPRPKHVNVMYHFFWQYVTEDLVTIHKINTECQPMTLSLSHDHLNHSSTIILPVWVETHFIGPWKGVWEYKDSRVPVRLGLVLFLTTQENQETYKSVKGFTRVTTDATDDHSNINGFTSDSPTRCGLCG